MSHLARQTELPPVKESRMATRQVTRETRLKITYRQPLGGTDKVRSARPLV